MGNTFLNPAELYTPVGYSHVVTASGGTTVFIAGQVSYNADGELIGEGDVGLQAATAYANLKKALAAVGATPADVVRTCTYIVDYDPSMLASLQPAREEFYGDGAPATSTLLGVAALAVPEILVEIDAIAVID